MYSQQAIRKLGVIPDDLTNAQREAMDSDGFFIVEGVYSAQERAEMTADFDPVRRAR